MSFNWNRDSKKRFSLTPVSIIKYFAVLNLNIPHTWVGLIGFSLFATIAWQIVTGVLLAMGFIPEPMYVPASREVEDLEGYCIDDIFWLHERGVDYIFILLYSHLLRKMFLNNLNQETESSWKSGAIGYLLFQVVVFFGLVLCCTTLSDVTIRIAASILASLVKFKALIEWGLFTDRTLNSDSLTRMMILHYITAVFMLLIGLFHGVEMHYDWKSETFYSGVTESVNWLDEGLINEIAKYFWTILMLMFFTKYYYHDQETLSYEYFMWGDVGLVTEPDFLNVSPHWYFRPYMGWLTVVSQHYVGLFGLALFAMSFYFQPELMNREEEERPFLGARNFYKIDYDESQKKKEKSQNINSHYSLTFYVVFVTLLMSGWYAASFLPFGKYYHEIGGNQGLHISYLIVFWFLLYPSHRGGYSFGCTLKIYSDIYYGDHFDWELVLNNIYRKCHWRTWYNAIKEEVEHDIDYVNRHLKDTKSKILLSKAFVESFAQRIRSGDLVLGDIALNVHSTAEDIIKARKEKLLAEYRAVKDIMHEHEALVKKTVYDKKKNITNIFNKKKK